MLIMEMVGGAYVEVNGQQSLAYHLITTAEEALELAGILVLIRALLSYIADGLDDTTVVGGRR